MVKWQQVGVLPSTDFVGAQATERYWVWSAVGARRIEVRERASGRVILSHRASGGDKEPLVSGVYLAPGRAVVVDSNVGDALGSSRSRDRLLVFELPSGRLLGRPLPVQGKAAMSFMGATSGVYRGGLYYSSGEDKGRPTCVSRLDLAKLSTEVVRCVPKGQGLSFVDATASAVTWGQTTGGYMNCMTLQELTASSDAPGAAGRVARPLPGVKECWSLNEQVTSWGAGWTERPTRDFINVSLYARAGDAGERQYLGEADPWKIRGCGDWLYWVHIGSVEGVSVGQLYRWRPGSAEELVLQARGEAETIFQPTCHDRTITVGVAATTNGKTRVLALDPS